MKKLLIVVDMQNDFIDGSLGTPEAQAIVPRVIQKIRSWDDDLIFTCDTHDEDYLETNEGKHLPVPHCVLGTAGQHIPREILSSRNRPCRIIEKTTFASTELAAQLMEENPLYDSIELCGLCTDICVVSNALLLKACLPETQIVVDASCCAGTTPEMHQAALDVMRSCQIEIINDTNKLS